MLTEADDDLLQALQTKLVKVEAPEKALPQATPPHMIVPAAPEHVEPVPAPAREPEDYDIENDDNDEESDEVLRLNEHLGLISVNLYRGILLGHVLSREGAPYPRNLPNKGPLCHGIQYIMISVGIVPIKPQIFYS